VILILIQTQTLSESSRLQGPADVTTLHYHVEEQLPLLVSSEINKYGPRNEMISVPLFSQAGKAAVKESSMQN